MTAAGTAVSDGPESSAGTATGKPSRAAIGHAGSTQVLALAPMDSQVTLCVGAPSADHYICRPFMVLADDPRQQSLHGVGGPLPTAKAFGRGGARRAAVKQARLHEARSRIVGRRGSSPQVRPTICEPADSTPPAHALSLPARNRTGTQLEPRTLHPPPPRHHRGGETHVAETHLVGPQPVGDVQQQGDPGGAPSSTATAAPAGQTARRGITARRTSVTDTYAGRSSTRTRSVRPTPRLRPTPVLSPPLRRTADPAAA